MQVFCEKCGKSQEADEKYCTDCGAPYGGELWVLIVGALLSFMPLFFISTGDVSDMASITKLLFWYELPVLVAVGFLYDHNPKRRRIYFWGGGLIIFASVLLLLFLK